MIIGVGIDFCEIERIGEALNRQGQRFRNRICTEREEKLAAARPDPTPFYAGRFAAKEACAKALGTGITGRVRWHDIEVLADFRGRLSLQMSGGALRRARRLALGQEITAHVSITCGGGIAAAFVVIEAKGDVNDGPGGR
jgi:holo-[acyl-carrier protein] synthase